MTLESYSGLRLFSDIAVWQDVSLEAKDFIAQLLEVSPAKRLRARQGKLLCVRFILLPSRWLISSMAVHVVVSGCVCVCVCVCFVFCVCGVCLRGWIPG